MSHESRMIRGKTQASLAVKPERLELVGARFQVTGVVCHRVMNMLADVPFHLRKSF